MRVKCGYLAVLGLIVIVIGLSTGCEMKSTVSPVAVSPPAISIADFNWPDKNLEDRFRHYWSLRKAGDATGAFQMEAPHVQAMVIPKKYEGFYGKTRKDWLSIRVLKVDQTSAPLIDVDFYMITNGQGGFTKEIFFRDSWLDFKDQWVHVLKDPFLTGDKIG